MNTRIYKEIVQKHDTAESFLSLFFFFIDAIIYILMLYIFGCEIKKKFFAHRQKLSLLIILDALLRIIKIYITSFIYSLTKEILITFFVTLQFYLIISLLNEIFTDKNMESLLESLEIKKIYLASAFFFMFAIVINDAKVSLVQYILAIIALLGYGYYLGSKIQIFLNIIEKKNNPNYIGRRFTSSVCSFIVIYLIMFYVLKIFRVLVENQLYCSYIEMGSDIFKEVGKYLSFAFIIAIYYLYNKYIKEEDYDRANSNIQGVVNISSVSDRSGMDYNNI